MQIIFTDDQGRVVSVKTDAPPDISDFARACIDARKRGAVRLSWFLGLEPKPYLVQRL
jgi:hypothetical protein